MFGPLAAFGTGGIETELLADVTFRITPLTDVDADEMLASVRARRRLDGFRGRPAGDIEVVRETLLRVAYLADEVAQIAELELNPVIALPPGRGAVAVDAARPCAASLAGRGVIRHGCPASTRRGATGRSQRAP